MRSPTLFHCHASMSPTEVKATLIPPPGKAIRLKSPGVPGPVQVRRNDLLLLRAHEIAGVHAADRANKPMAATTSWLRSRLVPHRHRA